MKLKQKRIKCKCDNCGKETDWGIVDGESPVESELIKGWIVCYDITGGGAMTTGSESYDYCSIKCLHEGVDKHFNPSNELSMNDKKSTGN